MARPWLKTSFGNGNSESPCAAARLNLDPKEEFKLVRRIGEGKRNEAVAVVTDCRCFIFPDGGTTSWWTGGYTEIALEEVKWVRLMGGPILQNVMIDKGSEVYRLPSTSAHRGARIAATIADGAELVPKRTPALGPAESAVEALAEKSPAPCFTIVAVGSIVTLLGTLLGAPAVGLIVGIVVGVSLAVLLSAVKYLLLGLAGTEEWTDGRTVEQCGGEFLVDEN